MDNDEILYCRSCGGFITYDTTIVMYSNPLQYRGECVSCKTGVYNTCKDVNETLKLSNYDAK